MYKTYPSKILLAGEYTILMGSGALAIPFRSRGMSWKWAKDLKDKSLLDLLNYLKNENSLKDHFRLQMFEEELHAGWYLQSNIPQGYGLGSSGAVCAAVYDRYRSEEDKTPEEVHQIFKSMEAFFHGRSSGIDPMVSYYNSAVQITSDRLLILNDFQMSLPSKLNMVLLDSGIRRNTRELVGGFKAQLDSKEYEQTLKIIAETNQLLIKSLLEGNRELISESWMEISRMSIEAFSDMIPQNVLAFWKQGLLEESFYCKLCGAGGGGYFLVHCLDRAKMQDVCAKYQLTLIDLD
ncbi:MAG: hypothetical protein IPM92_13425 [Saprospiraceae bacterium]|nr:hypothetical protein [Saprospiraceae bacterium]